MKIKGIDIDQIAESIKSQSKKDLARAITIVENNQENYLELVAKLYSETGNSHIIGITGSPGTGKSSLVDKIASSLQKTGKSIAVIAIDPSSPFSKGAILGDRIRMSSAQASQGIFIRSLASRGEVGGLARSVRNIITLMEAFGYDYILIETVGSGQSEIEIMNLAHTTLVVLAPGLGDEIQAQKAGIMEIADVFVVNKADLPGAQKTAQHIQQIIHTEAAINRKQVPVLLTSPLEGTGIEELRNTIEKRWIDINSTNERYDIEMSRGQYRLLESLKERFWNYVEEKVIKSYEWQEIMSDINQRKIYPDKAAQVIFDEHFGIKADYNKSE